MGQVLKKIAILYILFIAIFVVQRISFFLVYSSVIGDTGLLNLFSALWAGKSLDGSMAGYLVIIPLIISTICIWINNRIFINIEKAYYVIISFLISFITILDLGLYGYWGFRLDMTPIFYFFTSPSSAVASATLLEMIIAPIAIIVLTVCLYLLLIKVAFLKSFDININNKRNKIYATLLSLVFAGLLFIPIRGGITVSTMNLSRAYFSQNPRLNHVAINPLFSLMYSATHQSNFKSQYRFFEEVEAKQIFSQLIDNSIENDTVLLKNIRPDIYLIIAESFSAHLMPSLGGEEIAMRLDSIANEGVLFTNFYANSFRTDRAIPAILSGFPSQPNTSLMKYVEKAEKLPSLPKTLKNNGYDISYYYGGDINFTNMLAYLVSQGFEYIIKDKDFTIKERQSKWGAHDDIVFSRLKKDIEDRTENKSYFTVIQTSSSHEPFQVPFHKDLKIKYPEQYDRANAFAYTDSCIGDFVNYLKKSGKWDKSLVVITPDHYGAYPKSIENVISRHHIPLIFAGGALQVNSSKIDVYGCQTDIVSTILSSLKIEHKEFIYSKNLLSKSAPHYAFFTEPEYMGMVTDTASVVYNLESSKVEIGVGEYYELLNQSKSYLQTIYNNLEDL